MLGCPKKKINDSQEINACFSGLKALNVAGV